MQQTTTKIKNLRWPIGWTICQTEKQPIGFWETTITGGLDPGFDHQCLVAYIKVWFWKPNNNDNYALISA